MNEVGALFSHDGFMPHGHCYLWQPALVWLHVISDSLITLAYFSIPLVLLYFVRRRPDVPFRWVFVAFGTFIISCGLTHVMEIWTLWVPHYWISGAIKALTALASVLTAVGLLPMVPQALALRSPKELERSNAELRKVEARFRSAIEGMIDAFFLLETVRDPAGKIIDFKVIEVNQATLLRMKLERGQMLGKLISQVTPPILYPAIFERYVKVVESQQPHSEELRLPKLEDGQPLSNIRWLHQEVVPQPGGLAVTSRDITARRSAEEFMLRNMSEGVGLIRASDDQIVFTNSRLDSMLGYGPGQLEQLSAKEIGMDGAHLRAQPSPYESEQRTKDGRTIWLRINTSQLQHPEYGQVWLVTCSDLSQRRADEVVNARLASIVESTHDAITSETLGSGIIETWNRGAELLYGYRSSEMIGQPAAKLVPPELAEEERGVLEKVARGERVDVLDTVRVHQSGRRLDVSLNASPIAKPGGEIVGVSTIARDISERKRQERLLQDSLREKGVLLAEVHHRVKNNLQVVSSLLKLHAERIQDPIALGVFQNAQSRVQAIALIHEMLYQSRDLGAVWVSDYAQSLLQALAQTHPDLPVRYQIDASGVLLPMDHAVPFGLILNELVTNSLKHAFTELADTGAEVKVTVRLNDTELELVVTDNGRGFPSGFEPSKSPRLGMHLIHSLTRQLGGKLGFRSHQGSEARLTFPYADRRAP
ncbi:MAG: PAS domain S-box protein [Deltaproteobacteria bacterium]|nr:PAS domain S-box protein [Deltaproteobacteria bacterium]